jgi:predicted nucleotidyltransferase
MEQIIKVYFDESENITEDIQLLKDFVAENPRMMIYNPKDELEKVSAMVEKLHDAMVAYKKSGINWRVFNRHLRGQGISQSDIDKVMGGVEQFFSDMGTPIN